MGTRLEVVIPGLDEPEGLKIMRLVQAELDLLVGQISNYDRQSALSNLNREAYDSEVQVTGYLHDLLSAGISYHEKTGGYYDFTLGGWTSQPDLIRDTGQRFNALNELPLDRRLRLEGGVARFLHPDVKIDAGGIGKGMALSVIKRLFTDADIRSAFISFGGSSVLGIGSHPHGDSWKVGILDPDNEQETIATETIVDQSLSISGNTIHNRKKYADQGHILDPVGGRFFTERGVVTVVSDDPTESEVLSTACLAAGKEKQPLMTAGFPGVKVAWYLKH